MHHMCRIFRLYSIGKFIATEAYRVWHELLRSNSFHSTLYYRIHISRFPTMASSAPYPSPPPSPAKSKADPILRNALRYTLSAKEYKTLHQYLISRSPPAIKTRAPSPPKYAALVQTKDDYNGAAIRASLRVFVTAQTSLELWDLIKEQLFARRKAQRLATTSLPSPFAH